MKRGALVGCRAEQTNEEKHNYLYYFHQKKYVGFTFIPLPEKVCFVVCFYVSLLHLQMITNFVRECRF
jgi:hypothetical protein